MSDRPTSPGLFGTPALRRGERAPRPAIPDAVRVVAVERFKMGSGTVEGADVTLELRGLRLRALVRAGRVVFGSLRGEPAVSFTAPGLEAEAVAAALDAAGGEPA